jgi:hypothetical protein
MRGTAALVVEPGEERHGQEGGQRAVLGHAGCGDDLLKPRLVVGAAPPAAHHRPSLKVVKAPHRLWLQRSKVASLHLFVRV